MPIYIYSTEFGSRWSEGMFETLLSALPDACRRKAMAAKRWQDAQAIVSARHLLKRALEDEGSPADLLRLRYSPFGRPFLEGGPDFNWSHSGSRIVCAIGWHTRIGIDIEHIRSIELADFRDIFPIDEWERILGFSDPQAQFYREWTRRESVLKADGRGLSGDFRNVKRVDDEEMRLGDERWYTREICLSPDYACHLASKSKTPAVCVRRVGVDAVA
ncbi:MAG: 4'-phosphopantetheinyl transferase superfamily protein [Puia sp.]|nr:4'-phosphopantetheinyl transferase superfamily protein [Puia sp.]